jgi:hypothetical protein
MTDTEKLKLGALFFDGLIDALGAPQMSHIAIGVWVRIFDDDNHCLTARAIADRSPIEDEEAVVDALLELERTGLVRLESVQEFDGSWTTRAHAVFSSWDSILTRGTGEL